MGSAVVELIAVLAFCNNIVEIVEYVPAGDYLKCSHVNRELYKEFKGNEGAYALILAKNVDYIMKQSGNLTYMYVQRPDIVVKEEYVEMVENELKKRN